MDREKMIEDLLGTIWDWELEALVEYAQAHVVDYYEGLNDEELSQEWKDWYE